MGTLTIETVTAAQGNDLEAMAEVITAMEPMVKQIAGRIGGSVDREECVQEGRIALWKALSRFSGGDMDNFRAFIWRTVEGAVQEAAREERNAGATGADRDATKVFSVCVKEANGDLDVAEALCQTFPVKGRRLSPVRAAAARMAWEGTVSIDTPSQTGGALADILESTYGIPEDLITAEDINSAERTRKAALVRAVIDTMGEKQATVIRHRWGIGVSENLGTGADVDDALAAELGTKPATVRVLRNQAHKSFASRYSKVTGLTPCDCKRCSSRRKTEGISL